MLLMYFLYAICIYDSISNAPQKLLNDLAEIKK